jgi:hypothetical protein
MKILKSAIIHGAAIQMEDWEECHRENRYAARSLQDAEEYYEYRCRLAEQRRI